MKQIKTTAFLFLLSLLALNSFSQTADEVINKWVDAMGGKEKLASIKSIYMESEMNIMNNMAAGKVFIVNGKGNRSETDFNGQKVIDCYTSSGGWSVNPLAGQATPAPMAEAQASLSPVEIDAVGPLFEYAKKGSKVELIGKEMLNGAEAFKLQLTMPKGSPIIFYIDQAGYHVVKMIMKIGSPGQEGEVAYSYADFRKTSDGFVMSYAQVLDIPGLSVTITVKKIEMNKEIDPATFDMPKS